MTPHVLLTRAPSVSRELTGMLRERGYTVSLAPLLEARLPQDTAPLREVIELAVRPQVPTWLVVTSANTVAALARVAADRGWGARVDAARSTSPGLRVAAVGPATAQALREVGIGVDFMPRHEHSAAGMLAQWPADDVPNARALLPASELASPALAQGLRERGHRVVPAVAYLMVAAPSSDPLVPEVPTPQDPPVLPTDVARTDCARGRFHAVVVTAPSRVAALLDDAPAPQATAWVAIGEPTARALHTRGLRPTVAQDATAAALADAVDRAVAPWRATSTTGPTAMTDSTDPTEENTP